MKLATFILLGSLLLLGAGCFLFELGEPPFDASGGYAGIWESEFGVAEGKVYQCAAELILEHRPNTFPPANLALDGTIHLNFTCAAVLAVMEEYELPAVVEARVLGALTEGGDLLLGSVDLDGHRDEVLVLNLHGEDADEDGSLDRIEGSFTLLVEDARDGQRLFPGTLSLRREE